MATVQITGPATIGEPVVLYGDTYWPWNFPVVVDGQAGIYTAYVNTNDPSDGPGIAQTVVDTLTADPGDLGLGGIVINEPGTGDGDRGDGDQGDGDRGDGDDDGQVADGGSGDPGAGDSV